VPAWLLDSPFHAVMRIQGELDAGPTGPHPEFTPYENALPLLDAVAARLDSRLVPIVMAWERPGPWVYPDCFPPVGGEESLRRFTAAARERGWRGPVLYVRVDARSMKAFDDDFDPEHRLEGVPDLSGAPVVAAFREAGDAVEILDVRGGPAPFPAASTSADESRRGSEEARAPRP
jgi:hypothetical protein